MTDEQDAFREAHLKDHLMGDGLDLPKMLQHANRLHSPDYGITSSIVVFIMPDDYDRYCVTTTDKLAVIIRSFAYPVKVQVLAIVEPPS